MYLRFYASSVILLPCYMSMAFFLSFSLDPFLFAAETFLLLFQDRKQRA